MPMPVAINLRLGHVLQMDDLLADYGLGNEEDLRIHRGRICSIQINHGRIHTSVCHHGLIRVLRSPHDQTGHRRLAEPLCFFQDRIEDRLLVRPALADDP